VVKAKTPTSCVADTMETRRSIVGFSLFEMMVALSVLALSTSIVMLMVAPRQAERRLDGAVTRLERDLQSAQLQARRAGTSYDLLVRNDGYDVPAAGISVQWPSAIRAEWQARRSGQWRSVQQLRLTGAPLSREAAIIELTAGAHTRTVRLQAITGRVDGD
jgi:prepilin-type N-terminal cleavage/methylation domain-containing protein